MPSLRIFCGLARMTREAPPASPCSICGVCSLNFLSFKITLGLPTPTTALHNTQRDAGATSCATLAVPFPRPPSDAEVLLTCFNLFRSLCLALSSAPRPTHCLLSTTWLQLSRAIAVSSPCHLAHTLLALPYHCLTRFTRGCTTASPSSIVIDLLVRHQCASFVTLLT